MELENIKIDASLEKEITEYEGFSIIVDDKQSFEIATAEVLSIGSLIKKIESWWDAPIKQAHALHKSLTSKRGEMVKPLEAKQAEIKKAVSKYLTDQENARREAQRIADEAAKKAEEDAQAVKDAEIKRLAAEAVELEAAGKHEEAEAKHNECDAVIAEPVMVIAPVVESVDKTSRFETGSVSGKADIEIEVTDIKALLQAIIDGRVPETVIEVLPSKIKAWAKITKATTGNGIKITDVVNASYRSRTA